MRTLPSILMGASLLALTGCGGGSEPASAKIATKGELSLTVVWPQPKSRFLPAASNAVVAKLVDSGGNPIGSPIVIARPTSGDTSTVHYSDLAPGFVTLNANAVPNADGTGTAQAVGAVQATIVAGQDATVTVTMESTVTQMIIAPANPILTSGQTQDLTVTPENAQGQAVLVAPQYVNWTSDSPTNVSVLNTPGLTNTIDAISPGTSATITVTDTEPGGNSPSGTTLVTVNFPATPGPAAALPMLAGFGGLLRKRMKQRRS